MKLAILGNSPIALEAALRFHLHGAAFTWYMDTDDLSLFSSPEYSSGSFTSDLGQSILKELGLKYTPPEFSWDEWVANYKNPIVSYLKAHQEIRNDEVVSISKRFLAPGETINNRSRFLDLFRVIYKINPKDFIEEQKETNPETYQRLTEEFVRSLASSIEMYQDYDLVLDLRNDLSDASISISGRALGEGRKSQKVLYALEALKTAKTLKPSPDVRELALIGADSLAGEILLALEEWIKEPRSRLFIISHEASPFTNFLENANSSTSGKLQQLFSDIDQGFESDVNTFTRKLREWQELDDFVQVKIPRPTEPIPRINFFSGHNVSAVDELIDRNRMFLTLEKPEFRAGDKHPENNLPDLKTLGVDYVLVAHARKDMAGIQLDHGEKGLFSLTPARPNINGGWEKDLLQLEGIEDEIFKLFSPVDSH